VTALEHCTTTKVKPTGMNTVFHENTKLKREEEEEEAIKKQRPWIIYDLGKPRHH
jgi:hypothetical protein